MHVCSALQSCLTLCDPLDCSPPGFSVHEILQATILEWVAIPFSRSPPSQGSGDNDSWQWVCFMPLGTVAARLQVLVSTVPVPE